MATRSWRSALDSTRCVTPASRWSCVTRRPPGTQLPDRWGLPDDLRDDTGVIFASAFPGFERFANEIDGFAADHARRDELAELEASGRVVGTHGEAFALAENRSAYARTRQAHRAEPYGFDRRFLFHVLSMGHSQFADLIGARGPNTQINSACASTTQAVAIAEDWIRAGRCRRVVVIAADDITSDSSSVGSAPASSPVEQPPPTTT